MDAFAQDIAEDLQGVDVTDHLQTTQVIRQYTLKTVPPPAIGVALIHSQEWLGKPAHCQQSVDDVVKAHRGRILIDREWMESPVVVTSKQRIATLAIDVEPSRACDEDLMVCLFDIVDAFNPSLPFWHFMQLIEDQQAVRLAPLVLTDDFAMHDVVIVEI